ncbi:hypothetical protein PQX77_014988 [Marasmius sp. AFHP31]|nr:hypothetical protein PQX77_014988 [Marasmius sp. AFHP31]
MLKITLALCLTARLCTGLRITAPSTITVSAPAQATWNRDLSDLGFHFQINLVQDEPTHSTRSAVGGEELRNPSGVVTFTVSEPGDYRLEAFKLNEGKLADANIFKPWGPSGSANLGGGPILSVAPILGGVPILGGGERKDVIGSSGKMKAIERNSPTIDATTTTETTDSPTTSPITSSERSSPSTTSDVTDPTITTLVTITTPPQTVDTPGSLSGTTTTAGANGGFTESDRSSESYFSP